MARSKIAKEQVSALLAHLGTSGTVIAPHAKGQKSFTFQEMSDPTRVVLDYPRTLVPPKKYFLPPKETLLTFDLTANDYARPDLVATPRIFVGLHSYDMQGLLRLDHAFSRGVPEANYLKRRENCRFVGVSYQPDEYHFASSVGIPVHATEGFDLYLSEVEGGYLLEVLTEAGAQLVTGFDQLEPLAEAELPAEPKSPGRLRIHYHRLPDLFARAYESAVWAEVSRRCTGCGSCNLVCPTCYCFDVRDDVAVDAKGGERVRLWDACMAEPFAEVAGGENFRHHLSSRQRHRLYRKFKYQSVGTEILYCIGCGRCSSQCTAGIVLTEIVNAIYEEQYGGDALRRVAYPSSEVSP
ncbi:MAG: hypothetical protein FJ125_01470 [Deltaproteobacteria bacterium]|nr:hypothetical protein [Deltaproteobacteria bacterium]